MRVWRGGTGAAGIGVLLALATLHAHDPITTRITWTGDVSRIVEARCVSCHSPGGRAPMPLTTYTEARPWARAIREEVLTRRMPKWHAARGFGDFSNDPSLSPFEIALIVAWVDGGAPYGTEPGVASDSSRGAHAGDVRADARVAGGSGARALAVECREQRLPEGTLHALQPLLARGGSLGLAVRMPDGRHEILAWIRDFDPDFPVTYELRRPLELPRGSRLIARAEPAGAAPCVVNLTVAPPRSRKTR